MILRPFDPAAGDGDRLAGFTCSTGQPFEDEVEAWIGTRASAWLNDIPRTTFQRRALGLLEEGDDLVAVVAWQDIVRVDLEGIWLEVLAVATSHQHSGRGRQVYDLTIDHLGTIDRDGDHIAGLVHGDNRRSQRLLTEVGWTSVGRSDDHDLWVGAI